MDLLHPAIFTTYFLLLTIYYCPKTVINSTYTCQAAGNTFFGTVSLPVYPARRKWLNTWTVGPRLCNTWCIAPRTRQRTRRMSRCTWWWGRHNLHTGCKSSPPGTGSSALWWRHQPVYPRQRFGRYHCYLPHHLHFRKAPRPTHRGRPELWCIPPIGYCRTLRWQRCA